MGAPSRLRPQDDERGAYLIIWALLATALFTMVAIVIDLGQLRQTRRDAQRVADLAALASGEKLSAMPQNPQGACQDIMGYIRTNLDDLPPATSLPCSSLPASCTAGNPLYVPPIPATPPKNGTVTAGPYTITVRFPVPAAEIADARFVGGVTPRDGKLCQRIRVTIARVRGTTFAGILGVGQLTTKATAVARASEPQSERVPSLWLLDPQGCTSLEVSGTGTTVHVGDDTTSPVIPGVVTIDSDGSKCSGSQTTISAGGGSKLRVVPTTGDLVGSINLHALPVAATTCNPATYHDCDPANFSGSDPNIYPFPERQENRATRGPIDWLFDCKGSYPAYRVSTTTSPVSVPIDPCPDYVDDLTTEAHITVLRKSVNPSWASPGDGVGTRPTDFREFPGDPATPGNCNNPPLEFPVGNWYVNCNTFSVKDPIEFKGGNVVFDGNVAITAGGVLSVNTGNPKATMKPECQAKLAGCLTESSQNAAFVYVRKGDVSVAGGGGLNVHHTAVYQDNGIITFNAQGTLRWTSPAEGPLKALAFWNETDSGSFSISGGAAMYLDGIFFTPFAHPFDIAGGSPTTQQKAQFVSQQAKITGGGTLNVAPDAFDFAKLEPEKAILIR